MAKVVPRNGLVTIRLIRGGKSERKTSAGIVVPNVAGPGSDVFQEAEIIAIGRGIWDNGGHRMTDDLIAGQRVLVKAGVVGRQLGEQMHNYIRVDVDGEDICLINQHDIFAILEASPSLALAN